MYIRILAARRNRPGVVVNARLVTELRTALGVTIVKLVSVYFPFVNCKFLSLSKSGPIFVFIY